MSDLLNNPVVCPSSDPEAGKECPEAGLVCKYGDDPDCRSRWSCTESRFWSLDFAQRDCAEVCPGGEPEQGDDCEADKAQCTYGRSPECRSLWVCWDSKWVVLVEKRDCEADVYCPESTPETGEVCSASEATPNGALCVYEGGAQCSCNCGWGPPDEEWEEPEAVWYCGIASAEYDPTYLRACPLAPPAEGTACDTESGCGYVSPDECEVRGSGSTLAQCVSGEWALSSPESN
jgi:hypothetical protein